MYIIMLVVVWICEKYWYV